MKPTYPGIDLLAAGADVVMLDNLAPGPLATAAAALKRESPHILIEASGGITAETIEDYMCAGKPLSRSMSFGGKGKQ